MSSVAPLRAYAFQTPWALEEGEPTARLFIYRQGATMTTETSISPSASTAVPVADVGAIAVGDNVQLGAFGPTLSVTSITPPHSITLHNGTAYTATAEVGMRLVDISDPPTAYSDPTGATPLPSPLVADSSGAISACLPDGQYDAVLLGQAATWGAAQTKIYNTASGNSTNWSHTVDGNDPVLMVGVSWQSTAEPDSIASIAYRTTVDGVTTTQNLIPVVQGGLADLWSLGDPIPGDGTIIVTWTETADHGAVCGSVVFNGAYQPSPILASASQASSSSLPKRTLSAGVPQAAVFAVLAVNAAISTTTITHATGSELWNAASGSLPAGTRMQGAAIAQPGEADDDTAIWGLSASKPWMIGMAAILPSQTRLSTDIGSVAIECGGGMAHVRDFGSLAQAIDAVGSRGGGTIYIPNGNYTQASGLSIEYENISLIGESRNAIILPGAANLFDLLTVNAAHFSADNLTLDGRATSQDASSTGRSSLVVNGLGTVGRNVLGCTFRNVVLKGAPKYGAWLQDTIATSFYDCEFVFNQFDGVRIESVVSGAVAIRLIGCAFSQNGGRGLVVNNCNTLLVSACNAEGNSRDGVTGVDESSGSAIFFENLGVNVCITSCDFEGPGPSSASIVENLIYFTNSYACSVTGCNFSGTGYPGQQANRGLRTDLDSTSIDVNSCSWARFQAIDDSPSVPVDAVAALLGHNCRASLNNIENPDGDHDFFIYVPNGSLAAGVARIYSTDGPRPAATSVPAGTLIYVTTPTSPSQNLQISQSGVWVGIA